MRLLEADCLRALGVIERASVDLIYADPPFCSGRNYGLFEDRWENGINVYVNWMRERVMEMHRVLKPTGSIYLHCDFHASHYLKVMMDDVFGANNFQNEVVWAYKSGGATRKRWARKHDVILFYAKNEKKMKFNPEKEKSYNRGYKPYGFAGVKEYQDEVGWYTMVNMKDVWHIDMVGRTAKERLGYPTQKPEALLERIIKASSNQGDVILDPFCGCGTTVAVAERLGRQWIGIDISPTAISLTRQRLGCQPRSKVKASIVHNE